jgi:DNA (cytosine-5)-methyltransferase 1
VYDATGFSGDLPGELRDSLVDEQLAALTYHETRGHMQRGLVRYLFCSTFAETHLRPARAADFSEELAPDHQSWTTGKFAYPFRVQMWDGPSTTITSQISKEGHYFHLP